MIPHPAAVTLSEWETLNPGESTALAGRYLDATTATRESVARLGEGHMLGITELRHGLQIQAFSFVGRVRVGDLTITVLPKIPGQSLLRLLRYAFVFRRLHFETRTDLLAGHCGIEDLLILQLCSEAQELLARGLYRTYVPTRERLSSPRGRIDVRQLARDGGAVTASLPCQHFPRLEDSLLNRVLLAGLRLAAGMTNTVDLRRSASGLAARMGEQVTAIRLNARVLGQAALRLNRLTSVYTPAVTIIRLLVESQGVVLKGPVEAPPMPGFLFDMNAFFQTLVSRILRENLAGYVVHDERGLKGMMRYNPRFNPQRRCAPTPRPDYVITRAGKICAVLDAKYRDLWATTLPREMLYQLVVYAVAHRQHPRSVILYPTADPRAEEARIDITAPMDNTPIGRVCLRPIHLPTLEALLADTSPAGGRQREALANHLAFGSYSKTD